MNAKQIKQIKIRWVHLVKCNNDTAFNQKNIWKKKQINGFNEKKNIYILNYKL